MIKTWIRHRMIGTSPSVGTMVDPMDPTPYYVQVADAIAGQIESGELGPGDPIPSEQRIQQEWGVARGTARRAIAELVERGLVVTIRARGSFVRP